MKDLIPLKDLQRDDLEVSLLRSADDDQAPPAALRQAALALGVPAALIGVTAVASVASASVGSAGTVGAGGSRCCGAHRGCGAGAGSVAAGSVAASSVAAGSVAAGSIAAGSTAGTVGVVGLSKAVIVGLGASAVISGAVVTTVVRPETPAAVQSTYAVASVVTTSSTHVAAAPPRSAAPAVVPAPSASASASTPVIDVEALPRMPVAPSRSAAPLPSVASAAPEPEPPPAAPSSVASEVAELDRARALVAAKKPGAAIAVLDEFAQRWPRAILGPEAAVLRVEAELARGNRAGAERLARALIAAQPNSAYARKVANLVGIEQKE
ncbi:MAG TPA: tetratricopeptide repeat protein [Polyangiaceae bacterium]|nr:tetratricopeptide repeat protein [Polyangiaceae bacterium]